MNFPKTSTALVALVALLAGCGGLIVGASRVDWEPLGQDGCQNLSGHYLNSHSFYSFLGVSVIGDPAYETNPESYSTYVVKNIEWYRAASSAESSVDVEHTRSTLVAILRQKSGEEMVRRVIRLNTAMTGCRNGALVLRQETRELGSEGAGSTFSWSETEIRKLPDGSLEISDRGAGQSYGGLTGLPGRGHMRSPKDAPIATRFRVPPVTQE